jgi:long-subunit fatty acid transport protein
VLWLFQSTGQAQEEIFSLGFQLGNGARALAMGGAYTSIGGDYSATVWNPAGLAGIRRNEVFGTLSHFMRENTTQFSGINVQNDASFTKLDDFGMAYAVPTIRGSLVFSFGYNRVKTYDSNFAFEWFNNSEDDQVNQSWREFESGSLNLWTLAAAVDVSPNASVGLGLNFWTGGTNFESTTRVVDINNVYDSSNLYVYEDPSDPQFVFEVPDFESQTVFNNLDLNITGFNLKGGALFKIGPIMQLGATISTPVEYKVKEDFFSDTLQVYDDGFEENYSIADENRLFEYRIRSPWAFTGGASLHLLNFVFSGDVEYNDWTQVRYTGDFADNVANRQIRETYRPTARLRLGGEFNLPFTGMTVRAGYFRDPSIRQDRPSQEDKQFYSAGIGFLVDRQVKLDVAFVHGFWKQFNTNLAVPGRATDVDLYVEDIKVNKVFVTLAFRL